jgi:site-specific DNA recombinase
MQAALDRWGDPFGDHPFTTEQARLVQLLVERVDVREDALEVRIRAEGLASLVGELRQQDERKAA